MSSAEGFARKSELPAAPPSHTAMGVVLGAAARADEAAHDADTAAGHAAPPKAGVGFNMEEGAEASGTKRGGYGKLGGKPGANGATKQARIASWSDSGGLVTSAPSTIPPPPSLTEAKATRRIVNGNMALGV